VLVLVKQHLFLSTSIQANNERDITNGYSR
jgi:hypothetical protein